MTTMVRKQLYIEAEQERLLKQVAAEEGLSEAQLMREALDQYLEELRKKKQRIEAWRNEREFIQDLINQRPLPGGRTWGREELYDRRGL